MIRKITFLSLLVAFCCLGSRVSAQQVIWSNAITGASPSTSNPYFTGDVKASGVTVSGIGRGSGITGRTLVDAYSASSWTNSSTRNTNDYYYFTLSPSQCTSINFSNFQYSASRTSTGPTQFELRSSVDGYASVIGAANGTGTTISLTGSNYQNVTAPITFRLYGWASQSTGSTALFSILNFSFNGTVNSAPITITQQPSTTSNNICIGGNLPVLSVAATGTGSASYQWYSSTNGNNYNGTLIAGATASTYTIPNNTVSSRYYYCRVTYGACNIYSECSGLNIVANGPIITTQPSTGFTAYVCEGGVYVLSVISSSANVTYQWYSRVTTGGAGTIIPGATASSYQVPTNVSSSLYYYCVLTNSCGTTTSSTSRRVRVTVMSTKPSTTNQNVCLNGAITPLTVAMTGTFVTYTYAWYSNTIPSNTGGTLISGATSASFTPSSTVASSLYYYAVVSVSSNNTVQCSITSPVSGLITVSLTTVGGTITGGGLILCSGNNAGNLTLTGNVGSITGWQSSIDNGTTWATIANTTNTLSYSNITANTFYRANVQSGGCASAISSSATLTVTASPNFSITPLNSALCNGGNVNLSLTNNGSATYSGVIFGNDLNGTTNQNQWTRTTASGTLNWTYRESPYVYGGNPYNSNDGFFAFANSVGVSGVANLTSPSYNLTGFTNVTINYRTYYSDNSGNDFARVYYSSNGGTTWSAAVFTQASVGSRTTFSSQSLSVPAIYLTSNFKVRFEYTANNDRYWAIDNINISGTGTGFTYAWTPTTGLSASNIANPVATVNASVVYTGTVTNAFGCSNSYNSTIEVDNGAPSISINATSTTACSGNSIVFTAQPVNAGITPSYQWKLNGVNISGQTSETFISTSLLNGDIVSCSMTATNACGQSATVNSNAVTVTINANPTIAISGETTGCGTVNLVASGADTYLWSDGTTPNQAVNSFSNSGSYLVTGTNTGGCSSTQSVSVTINAPTTYYIDNDGDLYGDALVSLSLCTVPAGYVTNDLDCNDSDALISPSGTEECNGIDDDCNGVIDDGLTALLFYADNDGDGFGNNAISVTACTQPLNYVADNTDCDDANDLVNPGATEICNGIDDNCNTQIDEGVLITSYEDIDGDGFGDPSVSISGCAIPVGYVLDNTDCDIYQFTYNDVDNDGFGALPAVGCGVMYDTDDCGPNDPAINPAAQELCDGIDNDCDGSIDNGVQLFIYTDADGDGFGDITTEQMSCDIPAGFTDIADDCDDTNPDMFPLNPEVCDAYDNDCNGLINDGIINTYYVDGDGDGYGSSNLTADDCAAPVGFVADNTDCDDALAIVNPGEVEICDLVDNNCDGFIDEGYDADGDGVAICNGDCDDNDPLINAFVVETCDGIDNNCNNVTDEGFDLDFDGFTTCSGDCDDSNDQIGPGALEICENGIDEDCDGTDLICPVYGCTDVTAFNYNPAANTDDGSCIAVVNGCTDATAFNYNPAANTDDGSCIAVVNGCTDATAFNYNPAANTDDGSCIAVVNGCTDATAFNYNPAANTDDGSCIAVVNGCTDATAFNYNPAANTDDGSCIAVVNGCTDATAFNYNPAANTDDGSCISVVNGCTDATAFNYNPAANTDDGSCISVVNGCTDATAFNYNPAANTDDGSCISVVNGCTDATAFNYNPAANTDDGSCIAVVNGCTDATAFNYNPAANTDDGSCISVVNGCTDATAFNYNPAANTDDGTCIAVVNGCTDATAFNYNPAANTDDGSCIAVVNGCTDVTAFNYNPAANTDDGSCIAVVNGCTDATATNYNPAANTDDGSCNYSVNGCTDVTACNYNAQANTDDGSCTYPTLPYLDCSGNCINDVDGDGECAEVDCDDTNAAINSSAAEVCNGVDDNCDTQIDEGLMITSYEDIDGDGFGDAASSQVGCDVPTGYVLDNTDCDIFQFTYDDIDGDGFGAAPAVACGLMYDDTDCNPTDPSVSPAAQELCDGIDNDCDGTIDNGVQLFIYVDADGDGFGDVGTEQTSCDIPAGYSDIADDCDDTDATAFPGAVEVCGNGIDENCDGVDDICPLAGCTDAVACNYDAAAITDDGSCQYPAEVYLDCNGNCLNDQDVDGVCDEVDCDDTNPAINQNVLEACNEYDDNCDGNIDEGLTVSDYFVDGDNDGYGDVFSTSSCTDQGQGFSTQSGDCADNDISINPGVSEICNGIDDNCDGNIDEGFTALVSYADTDGDGYGDDNVMLSSCEIPAGYVLLAGDCDDTNPTVYSGGVELCDGLDNDCDGAIDDGLSAANIAATPVVTALYPTCSTGNLFTANMNLGTDSPITAGAGLDLWYSLTAQTNVLRVSLSAATGMNAIELYQDFGSCIQLVAVQTTTGVSNQILINDQLSVGGDYYVACRAISGPSNPYAKICFSHFEASVCDHSLVNNTGIYPNVCASFKVQYRGNAVSYGLNVNSAEQGGVDLGIEPWSYTTPTSSQIISRVGYFLPANFSGAPITYDMTVDVNYALPDAMGNLIYFTAQKGSNCQLTLNAETDVQLRAADRCPSLKSVSASIYTDHQICGAVRYDWKLTRFQPTFAEAIIVEGSANANYLNLATVPGIANNQLYKVEIRPVFDNGVVAEWGLGQCMKTTASGMILDPNAGNLTALTPVNQSFSVFPNPSLQNEFILSSDKVIEGKVTIKMIDLLGNVVYTDQLNMVQSSATPVTIKTDLAKGVYLIKIQNDNKEQTIRWIKQ